MYNILNQIFISIYMYFNLGNRVVQKSYLPRHVIKTARDTDSKELSEFVIFSHTCVEEYNKVCTKKITHRLKSQVY